VRDLLRHYIAMKIQDLFPEGTSNLPNLENLRTLSLLEEMQERLVALVGSNASQRWLQSQALQLLSSISETRWLLVEQNTIGIAVPTLVLVVFWLSLLFLSFGLFAPRNRTAIIALFLCALGGRGSNRTGGPPCVTKEGVGEFAGDPLGAHRCLRHQATTTGPEDD
jgi:hypothetical protein